jgi:sugar lactone lactonase YvrE
MPQAFRPRLADVARRPRAALLLPALLSISAGCAGGDRRGPGSARGGAGGGEGGAGGAGSPDTAPGLGGGTGADGSAADAGLAADLVGGDDAGAARDAFTPPPPMDAGGDALPPLPPALPLDTVRMAQPELYVRLMTHVEGPTWRAGELIFGADGLGGGMMRVSADRRLFRYHPGMHTVGTRLLADGTILVCDGDRKLVQMFRDGKLGVVADEYQGQPIPFCNDLSVDAAGNVYFSDFRAAIYRVTPAGAVTRLSNLTMPNGVEVDPASKFLYIIDGGTRLRRVPLPADGAPFATPETVATLEAPSDGCAFDAWGNLWIAVNRAARIAIYSPERGQVLASIASGAPRVTNLTFGGPARDVLYVTNSNSGVYRIAVGARGFEGHPGAAQYRIKRMIDLTPANTPVP